MQQKLKKQEEEFVELQETFQNVQQEIEIKTKRLKKYFAKYQSLKQEIKDIQVNFKTLQDFYKISCFFSLGDEY